MPDQLQALDGINDAWGQLEPNLPFYHTFVGIGLSGSWYRICTAIASNRLSYLQAEYLCHLNIHYRFITSRIYNGQGRVPIDRAVRNGLRHVPR